MFLNILVAIFEKQKEPGIVEQAYNLSSWRTEVDRLGQPGSH